MLLVCRLAYLGQFINPTVGFMTLRDLVVTGGFPGEV